MNNLWIDVTMLVNWSGKMTGIQRVEYNLAKRFATRDNVKFFVFDKSSNILIDFDFKHIEYKINSQQNETEQAASLVVHAPVRGLRTLPIRAAKKLLRPTYRTLKTYSGRILRRSSDLPNLADIQTNDTVLVLSGDWSDDAFVTLLLAEKTTKNLKIVQVIYDMLPALYPEYFVAGMPDKFSNYMKNILPKIDLVLAISESTKRDIEAFIVENKLGKTPVEVFRLGDDFVSTLPEKPATKINGEFILTVGTVEARKNHKLIYEAYRKAQNQNIVLPTIVVAGKRGWLTDELFTQIENDKILSKKFIFLQPTDGELAWLYKNCLFTVFPSIYEGWGLPIAESLFNGKLSIASNSSSMPEIAGPLIDYFSPTDANELLDKIVFYVSNRKELAKKESKLKKLYNPTSWDQSFDQVEKSITKFTR